MTQINKSIGAIIITAIVVGGGWYLWQQETPENQKEIPPTTQPQYFGFTNFTYGFTLTFPQTWESYITKNRSLDWGTLGASDSIDFGFLEQDSLFNISVFSKSQWQQIVATEEGPRPLYLGESDQYVFAYGTAQDAYNDVMRARMAEIEEIIKTFTVTK
ncbi:MAG: hypothetical protein AAB833_01140 [Patescibacteria group bacterium]